MFDNLDTINQWLDLLFSYGVIWVYLVIFLACFIENIFPPFPGDTFIVAAGALVGLERLDLIPAVLSVISGGVLSVMVIYFFGKNKGYNFFKKKNYKLYSEEDIEKSNIYFKKYGALILIFSRFVVGFRSALALAAGVGQYQVGKMFLYSLISYILFTSLLMYSAIAFIENYDNLASFIKTYNWIVLPLLIIIILLYILSKLKKQKDLQE